MKPQSLDPNTKILVIRINHSNAGLFAYVTFVLNQVLYCEEHDLLPVVYFGPWSVDGPNAYHDPEKGDNMWDHYFEPVAGYTYGDIQALIADPDQPITEDNLVYLDDDVMSYLHGCNPDSIYNYPYGYYTDLQENPDDWYSRQRHKAQGLMAKYIQVKKELVMEVGAFVENHFNDHQVLGLHIRGTDKGCATEAKHLSRIISPKKYYPHINEYIEQHPDAKIFLATDQAQYVDELKAKYPGRVLTQSTILSDSRVNSFQKADGKNYQKGKEVLLDCLILSRCHQLLKCASAVGEYAFYFNADLSGLDLNELYGRPNTIRKLRTLFLAEPYVFFRDMVQMAKNPEKSKSALFWFILTEYPLIRRLSNKLEETQFTGNPFRSVFFFKKYVSLLRSKELIPYQQVRQFAAHARKRRGSDYYSFRKAKGKKYLEIRTDGDPHAAFFAQFVFVLQQLRFAETHQLIPIVNLDHQYNYYFDKDYPANVWENYFEPVKGLSSSELDQLDPKTITFLRPEEQRLLFLGEGDQPPIEYDSHTREWWQKQREMGGRLTAKYIRIRPEILSEVDKFYKSHFRDQPMLGLHLRGTDKSVDSNGKTYDWPELFIRIVPPEEYFPFIDKFLALHPQGKVFVATDQKQFLTILIDQYGDSIMHTAATRSDSEKAVFDRSGKAYLKGVEVLKDALLLSRCDFLIKCMSNVGEAAVYFNPDIPVVDIFYPYNIDRLEHFYTRQ